MSALIFDIIRTGASLALGSTAVGSISRAFTGATQTPEPPASSFDIFTDDLSESGGTNLILGGVTVGALALVALTILRR